MSYLIVLSLYPSSVLVTTGTYADIEFRVLVDRKSVCHFDPTRGKPDK